jgi:hypothetical protein
MKRLVSFIFALLIFFYIFPNHNFVLAQDAQGATESAREEKVEYSLAYPGILPDNPLHFLKAARDRIILFLISDPLKKTEFNLLTSDKRIYAADLLADRDKDDIAISTLSKSNNYFHQAVVSIQEAKKAGKNVDTVLHNLNLAVKKHLETLETISGKVDRKFGAQLQYEKARLEGFGKSVADLLPN